MTDRTPTPEDRATAAESFDLFARLIEEGREAMRARWAAERAALGEKNRRESR